MCKQTLFIVYIMCTSNPIPWSFEMSWYITSFCDHQSVLPTRTPLSSDSTELTSNSIHPGKGRASARGRGVENPQLSSEKKNGLFRLDRGLYYPFIWSNYSNLTRPHPKWWFSNGIPLISGKSELVKYYNLARSIYMGFCNKPFEGSSLTNQYNEMQLGECFFHGASCWIS